MRSTKTEAIVIRRRNYGESDRLLTLFTKDQGKIMVKATGVRKITSRRASHIEPLNYVAIALYQGKKYATLTEAQTISTFADIKHDLKKVSLAYHICELIDGLCPENQENHAIFVSLLDTLEKLGREENSVDIVHGFEIELLTLLGYWHGERFPPTEDAVRFIEDIMERKLKSKHIFRDLVD